MRIDFDKRLEADPIQELAKAAGFRAEDRGDSWRFFSTDGDFLYEICVDKTGNTGLDEIRMSMVLNEAVGNGYTDSGMFGSLNGEPYVEYRIVPLVHNLDQKTPKGNPNRGRFLHTGDHVRAYTKDAEEVEGRIVSFHRGPDNNIDTMLILDKKTGKVVRADVRKGWKLTAPIPVRRRKPKMLNTQNIVADGLDCIGGRSH